MLLRSIIECLGVGFIPIADNRAVGRVIIFDHNVLETTSLCRRNAKLFLQRGEAWIRVVNNDRVFGHGRVKATEQEREGPPRGI